jgi:hypothetical protein
MSLWWDIVEIFQINLKVTIINIYLQMIRGWLKGTNFGPEIGGQVRPY